MGDVLILGGTGWLSGHIARAWRDAGASVTCLARGSRPAPDGTRLVPGDRDDPGVYDALAATEWDAVVDVSSRAAHVEAAVRALGVTAAHWTYVSTVSVYAAADRPGADESAALLEPARFGDAYDYGREKVAAEASVRAGVERAAIVRPGLIVGPGDPTDRFGYWVSRFALAGDGPVLVPDAPDARAQVIDVADAADFVVTAGRERWTGVADAVGDSIPLAGMLATARGIAGHTGPLVAVDPARLASLGVAHWMGARSLPLWLPDDLPGFATRSHAAYTGAGGRLRPLADTMARVLADERRRGLDRPRAAGLTRADELAVLAVRDAD